MISLFEVSIQQVTKQIWEDPMDRDLKDFTYAQIIVGSESSGIVARWNDVTPRNLKRAHKYAAKLNKIFTN